MFWRMFQWVKGAALVIFRSVWLRLLFAVGVVAYAVVHVAFYCDYGLRVVTWHTHLAFPIYLALSLLAVAFILSKVGLITTFPKWKENILYGCWLLWCFETLIMLTGISKVSNEDGFGYYLHQSHTKRKSFYHVWPSASRHFLSRSEFRFDRKTNSLGFPDVEWIKEKPEGAIRILCFGDSFTEGDGAHADSSYVALLRSEVQKKYKNVEVMNAGVCGSDPFYNFANLKDRLIHYKPDIVLQIYSSNDLFNDFVLREGMERFENPPFLSYKKGPWWEPLYAVSYVFRAFVRAFGYNHDLTKFKGNPDEIAEVFQKHADFFIDTYHIYAKEQAISVIFISLPMREDVATGSYYFDHLAFLEQLKKNGLVAADLLPCYLDYIKQQETESKQLYWVQDAHHNAAGYALMAKCISGILTPTLDSIFFVRQNLLQQPVN